MGKGVFPRPRDEEISLAHPSFFGKESGGGVDSAVGDLGEPGVCGAVEGLPGRERSGLEKILLDVLEGILDLSLPVGVSRPAEVGLEHIVLGKLEELRIPEDFLSSASQGDGGHIVVDDASGDTLKEVEGVDVSGQESGESLLAMELNKELPGVT